MKADRSMSILVAPDVGWTGGGVGVAEIPALIHLLETADDAVKLAVGTALDRLLGARLIDTIEVTAETLEDIDLPNPDPEAKKPRPELEAHDAPPEGAKEKLDVPSIDPDRWKGYWSTHGQSVDPRHRIRRGQPHCPSVTLYELDQLPLGVTDRRCLQLELVATTGKWTHFDPHDFVAVQEECLKAWELLVHGTSRVPGSWRA